MGRCVLALGLTLCAATSLCAETSAESKRLHQLFDREWQYTLKENPVNASFLGDKRYNDRWMDISLEAIQRRHQHAKKLLDELATFDADKLDREDQINLRLFQKEVQTEVEGFQYGWHLLPLNQRDGIQTQDDLANALNFSTSKDYQDWLKRLDTFPKYMDQTIALMREGIKRGMVHPKIVLGRIPEQISKQIVDNPERSPFFKKFEEFPAGFTASDIEQLRSKARSVIATDVVPAYERFLKFFEEEYLPAGYDRVGAWQMPQGREMYAFRARLFTTTDMTPEEIHKLGLREVERIRAEMQEIIKKVEFEGTFEEFLSFLRTDPQFYFDDPQELLEATRALCKRIDPYLVSQFGRLPRMPYGVEPIPANIAPDTTTAYYRPPAANGSRAGSYFVNLFRPEVRPKYEMEALTLHEAVPGHHLQIALAMELDSLPNFRRYGGYTAFVEGWGLYSERLGGELGCYKDPYSKFGQLTYEMWRAVRLVVDTGMHHHGWTRDKAIEFFKANAAKAEHDIKNEIDRYIAWPGQALAYKIGEIQIRKLKSRAQQRLGDKFDIRQFHDTVLGSGAVPLDVLEEIVDRWIEQTMNGS